MEPENRVAQTLKDKTILVTGATGFLGKVVLEKILRTCPEIEKIYALVRTKRGKTPERRMKEVFSSPLYDLLKKTQGDEIFKKVTPIQGDVSKMNLGLSEEDCKLLVQNTNILIHMAATVRFDDPLNNTILLNTRGTQQILELSKNCEKLEVFIYISTAYCHPQEQVLYEKLYPSPMDPYEAIRLAELLPDNIINKVNKDIIGDFPNSYSFSKALAEGLIAEAMDTVPIIIVRPSIIIPVWRDPLPGWTDNMNGPTGLLIAAGKGVLRTMYCNPTTFADFIPVDIAANALLLCGVDYLKNKERRVYNLTTSKRVKATWMEIVELGKRLVRTRIPFNWVAWYPGGSMKTSKWLHNFDAIFVHYIPAIIGDSLIALSGNKPVLWRVQKRLNKGFDMFEYYCNNTWEFKDDNLSLVRDTTNELERELYRTDEEGFDMEEYFYKCIRACRLFLLKESDETLPTARIHIQVMWVVDRLFKIFLIYFLLSFLWNHVVSRFFNI